MTLQLTDTRADLVTTARNTRAARKILLARALLLTALGLSIWPSGAAAEVNEYKCYVLAEDGTPHLRMIETQDVRHVQQSAARPLKLTKTRVIKIMQVVECQTADASFADPAARLLDERTPR